ncbi:MAG TPA: uroporphyrinogen decarboxylase family protein [Candidatus Hydrogenedentes bacterium]|nr:uroporphyrinogen decarboxylase family protein [Candidatus Hydrogenedentota bacterium]HQH52823.1 uroporphyrinogen decarboxylase family protein [Candidatus Hydrogenedentota bacterium]
MAATSRELVHQTLNLENPSRAPRNLWTLPWAEKRFPKALEDIRRDFPDDFAGAPGHYREIARTNGDRYGVGRYVDEWGCVFENIQEGVVGEVKNPQIKDWAADAGKVRFPREWLTIDRDKVNQFCGQSDKFVNGGCCPRPFEQLQFLRGTANLYMDLLHPPAEMRAFVARMHAFYCELLETWGATDVDALNFMDDWGGQNNLLIDPAVWRAVFKPLYRDYVQLAHGAGKRIFMHSDGHTLAIYPDLVELGVDAINSQLFCMGVENLAPFSAKITFWGEIDRQHLLPHATPGEIDRAVHTVHQTLWRNGGCIAQCEFGPGAKPENVRQVFASWDALTCHA